MYEKKSVVKCLFLTLVTLGVYGIIWYKRVTDEVRYFSDDESTFNGTMALFVSIITFGIYTYYWAYKRDRNLLWSCNSKGIEYTPNVFVYEFFILVGLYFVPLMIMQNYINEMIDAEADLVDVKKVDQQDIYDYWQQPWNEENQYGQKSEEAE